MSENKTHYRKVFKSDHLGVADIEDLMEQGSDLILTIREVKQEQGVKVAGRKGNHNIAYFSNKGVKPWVLNAGNSKIVKKLAGGSPFVEDWSNLTVQLYIDHSASFGGEITGGVRVNPNPPIKRRQVITPENKEVWQNVKNAYIRDKGFTAILKRADMSQANQDLMIKECPIDV
jgi:hypothetical protein